MRPLSRLTDRFVDEAVTMRFRYETGGISRTAPIPPRTTQGGSRIMTWEMLFILASLIVWLVVYVGAIIWVVRDAPMSGVDVSLDPISKELRELIAAEDRRAA